MLRNRTLSFDPVMRELNQLVLRQGKDAQCRIYAMPNLTGGTLYTIQIFFELQRPMAREIRQFLRSAVRIIRKGDRALILRSYHVKVEKNFEYETIMSVGSFRLFAAETVGKVQRVSPTLRIPNYGIGGEAECLI